MKLSSAQNILSPRKLALVNRAWLKQLLKFGVVGGIASAVHLSAAIYFISYLYIKPLVANVLAFMAAFFASYFGHRYYSFGGTIVTHRQAFIKLLLVALLGLAINEFLFFIFLSTLQVNYIISLLISLCITPSIVFVFNKFWVFKQ